MRAVVVLPLAVLSFYCEAGPLILPTVTAPFIHCTRSDGTNLLTTRFPGDPNLNCRQMTEGQYVEYVEQRWRSSEIAVGDKTNCGLVTKIARPIAKVQTRSGEAWLRIDELAPLIELDSLKAKDGKENPWLKYFQGFNPECPFKLNAN